MFKTLTLTTLLCAGMIGAETLQPEITPYRYTRVCEDGENSFSINFQVSGTLLVGDSNIYGRGEILSTDKYGKTIPWEFGNSEYSTEGDVSYDIKAPGKDIPVGAAFTVRGHLDLDVFDSVTYSSPVKVDFKKLAAGKKKFSIDGHTLTLMVETLIYAEPDNFLAYHLAHDGDKTLIGMEIVLKGMDPEICMFMEAVDEAWKDKNGYPVKDGDLDLRLPLYCAEGPVRVRAIYGKGQHTIQLPVNITVDTSCGAWAEFPEGFKPVCTRSEVEICYSGDEMEGYEAETLYTIQAPEGLRFHIMRKVVENKEGSPVELTAYVQTPVEVRSEDDLFSDPGLAYVEITATWKHGVTREIDETLTFTIPLCKVAGEPLEVTLPQDGTPQTITFAGHTYTVTLVPLSENYVCLHIATPGKTDDVEILVDGETVTPQYQYPEDWDDDDEGDDALPVFTGYGLSLKISDAPYTITFTRLEDAGTISLPVHIKGKAGEPFKK